MKSVFVQKAIKPTQGDLKKALGDTFDLWMMLAAFAKKSSPGCFEEWNFSSEKYGWSFRISDKKRVLVYLLPRDKFFKVGLVFGQKATDKILSSSISETVRKEIKAAKVYAEGRGIRIEVRDKSLIDDLKSLIKIKIEN